jgi:hypothetical protein
MITREEYNAALDTVEAYHRQLLTIVDIVERQEKKITKSLEDVKEGDFVECVFVHSSSTKHLTKGKNYEVLRVLEDHKFGIKSDAGVSKWYYLTSTHFKVI